MFCFIISIRACIHGIINVYKSRGFSSRAHRLKRGLQRAIANGRVTPCARERAVKNAGIQFYQSVVLALVCLRNQMRSFAKVSRYFPSLGVDKSAGAGRRRREGKGVKGEKCVET